MTKLHILGKFSAFKLASSNCYCDHLRSAKIKTWPAGPFYFALINPRFYGPKSCSPSPTEINPNCPDKAKNFRISSATRKLAQAALCEYLHCTRSLQYVDAEYISKNSPIFLETLIRKVDEERNVGWAVARYLRYHPINEFEPFFESTGLKMPEYRRMLPRNSIFLCDDGLLLENYHVLCNYGVERNKIGRIFMGASQIFKYDYGILISRIHAFEKVGLSRSIIAKLIVSSPYLLTEGMNTDFVEVVEKLKSVGLGLSFLEENFLDGTYYQWGQILGLLCLLSRIGCSEEQLNLLMRRHPALLFDGSGTRAFSLIGFLFKFGVTMQELCSVFLQFPDIHVTKFILNLRQCFLFVIQVDMESEDIGKVMRSHPLLLGQCTLKKANTVLAQLNVGKRRICKIILEDPQQMKNWVRGSKINRLPSLDEGRTSFSQKLNFLSGLGFGDDANEMKKAVKVFRGKGKKLQERFDCLVQAGLSPEDVAEMVKVAPQVLNQSKDVLEMKIDFLVNILSYPVSTLVRFPSYLNYQIKRVELRYRMHKWLVDRGASDPHLSLASIVSTTERKFIKQHVKHHPSGLQVFQELKRNIYGS